MKGLITLQSCINAKYDFLVLAVGNKNDDPERKVVETEDAYKFAGQMGIQLFETSAKENINVEEVSDNQGKDGRWRLTFNPTGDMLLLMSTLLIP